MDVIILEHGGSPKAWRSSSSLKSKNGKEDRSMGVNSGARYDNSPKAPSKASSMMIELNTDWQDTFKFAGACPRRICRICSR